MKSIVINALTTTAIVLVTLWVIAKIFPNLVGSVLSGATPDLSRPS